MVEWYRVHRILSTIAYKNCIPYLYNWGVITGLIGLKQPVYVYIAHLIQESHNSK